MATVNLGNIKFNWKGTYNAGTAYAIDDVVSYNGSSYVCISATTGNLPTVTAKWDVMSSAGTNGTDLTSTLSTRGDIVYKGASALERLPKGTAGYYLKQGANDPEWSAVSAGGVVQKKYFETNSQTVTNSQSYQATSLVNSITPTSASNKIWITGMVGGNFQSGNGSLHMAVFRQVAGGGYSEWRKLEGGWYLYAADTGGEHSINLYDTTHNSTGQVDYKVRILSENGSTCRVGGSSAYQTMSLLEIGV